MSSPLIQLRPYQLGPFWCDARQMVELWRRQAGKTYGFASKSLNINMLRPWNDVIFCSASINVGQEMIQKDVAVWTRAMDALRKAAAKADRKLESTFDGLDPDACCDIFEHQKLQVKIYHDRTSWSRTLVIAPNVATARGFTGTVLVDEIDFIPDFDAIYEAVEPIMSSDATFRLHMATTLGKNDNSWVYRNLRPPEGFDPMKVNPRGKWYTSTAGIRVHMLNAWDAYAAGLDMFDTNTGKKLTPEEHRDASLDRDAWDRNYGIIFKSGGSSALSRSAYLAANQLANSLFPCRAVEDIEPAAIEKDFPKFTTGVPVIGIGLDIATTTNHKSNPSAIAVCERVGRYTVPRLIGRFHSAEPARTRAILKDTIRACPVKPRFVIIDATSERFFAIDLRADIMREFGIPVFLYVASETIEVTPGGDKLTKKTYAGNLICNAIEDGDVPLPASRWLEDDLRSVRKEKGLFENVLDAAGNHGDCFDALKMAHFGFVRGFGPFEIEACGSDLDAGGVERDEDPPEVRAEREDRRPLFSKWGY